MLGFVMGMSLRALKCELVLWTIMLIFSKTAISTYSLKRKPEGGLWAILWGTGDPLSFTRGKRLSAPQMLGVGYYCTVCDVPA